MRDTPKAVESLYSSVQKLVIVAITLFLPLVADAQPAETPDAGAEVVELPDAGVQRYGTAPDARTQAEIRSDIEPALLLLFVTWLLTRLAVFCNPPDNNFDKIPISNWELVTLFEV